MAQFSRRDYLRGATITAGAAFAGYAGWWSRDALENPPEPHQAAIDKIRITNTTEQEQFAYALIVENEDPIYHGSMSLEPAVVDGEDIVEADVKVFNGIPTDAGFYKVYLSVPGADAGFAHFNTDRLDTDPGVIASYGSIDSPEGTDTILFFNSVDETVDTPTSE